MRIAERFKLVRLLGQGGMGSVWLADHLALEIPCAIKFIDRDQNSPEARRRFEREAKAAAQLRGQHVVQVLDHGIWENVPYIAMEYLEGEDLAARLDRLVRLPHAQTVRIISQVAKGLGRAHAAGIVHRDLKPENIFLTRDGDDEVVKVLDFGIAKQSQTSLSEGGTKTGSLMGTPFYMSPEQARGVKGIDHRSDLFSLAIIVYQCVTGKLPFYSEGLGDVLGKIMYDDIPVPSQNGLQVPPAFDAWWQRASARAVEARFQSAKELADTLALALGISNSIDIPLLPPRLPEKSSTDLSSAQLALRPTAILGSSPPPAPGHRTIDRPLSRTFNPTPAPSDARRKKAIVFGGAGLAVSLVILLVALAGKKSTREGDIATAAQGIDVPARMAVVPSNAEPAMQAQAEVAAKPGEAVARSPQDVAPVSAPSVQPAPRRKAKPTKGASKRDYGI
jgi:serine/threonine-protein kinase